MQIIANGILAQGERGTARAILTVAQVVALQNGTLLAIYRSGSSKDSDDERIQFLRSDNGGASWSGAWQPFGPTALNAKLGTVKICYLTELSPGRLLAAAMWVDRTTYPGQPLFNAETEGCLPMEILLAESGDKGRTWSEWRHIPMPEEIGPASLTNPVLKLPDGSLAMSIESNKHYEDSSRWYQKVFYFHSTDQGESWGEPAVAGYDPTGRIFNWDLRACVAPDGRIATFAWTYDTQTAAYLNIQRRISADGGRSWSAPEDIGITDQSGPPAVLADGRVVLAWVDRFGSHSIRARVAAGIDAAFDPASEVVIYTHGAEAKRDDNTGDLLAEMGEWSYGLPSATALPDGDVLVVYYAGDNGAMDIRWARLRP
ncbi:MAG: exo-alpha-sialidase [Caldilineaceae bacterium]|nr:exo-alpha-sialidase [Caldilineaceae bacterium]